MIKLTDNQAWALKMIRKFGRSTDKRAVNGLEKKGLITILGTGKIRPGRGADVVMTYRCTEKEKS